MKRKIRIIAVILILSAIIQSCLSGETGSEVIFVSERKNTSNLLIEEMVKAANSKNDYSLINFDCLGVEVEFYFLNPQGDYYDLGIESIGDKGLNLNIGDNWMSGYSKIKQMALDETGIVFTNEDFSIRSISYLINDERIRIFDKKVIKTFFEDCKPTVKINDRPTTLLLLRENSIKLSEVNFNCSGSSIYLIINGEFIDFLSNGISVKTSLREGVSKVEELLILYNTRNNTSYTKDNVFASSVFLRNASFLVQGKELIQSYFQNCKLERDIISNNDCLNFVYPIKVNRFDIQLEEAITSTIRTDKELTRIFGIDAGELRINYPVSLIGGDGVTITVKTNDELLKELNDAHLYCGYK